MAEFRTFEDLECWKACRKLHRWIERTVKQLPAEERYRMADHLLRAARSTTANIAEGYGLFHYQESIQFCRRSRGSAYEVLDHIISAVDEELLSESDLEECRALVETAVKLTNGYVRCVERQKAAPAVHEERNPYSCETQGPMLPFPNLPINESTNPLHPQ